MEIKCKVCESKFINEPILKYKDMPSRAQFFLEEKEINDDKGIELNIYQCPYCGMIQLGIEPVSYYKDVIRASGVSSEMKEYRKKYFDDFVCKYSLKDKEIIEIGTGKGEFLEIMNQTGAKAYGIEHCRESVDVCLKKNLNVYEGFVENSFYKIGNEQYDGFFIMNFLEHIPNPNEFLKGIFNNLNEGAIGLIEVPNVDMIIRNLMFSEFITDHLMYFTKKTLRLLLEKNGFEVLEEKEVWHDYVISMVVQKKKRVSLNSFNYKQKEIVTEINNFIDEKISKNFKVAIWGASHQALSVIAMCDIKEKLQFIVDSAEFKQNKYTPATHVKVVSPDELKNTNIEAIIIMAASYSDEVCRIIKINYPNIQIAILRENKLEIK